MGKQSTGLTYSYAVVYIKINKQTTYTVPVYIYSTVSIEKPIPRHRSIEEMTCLCRIMRVSVKRGQDPDRG